MYRGARPSSTMDLTNSFQHLLTVEIHGHNMYGDFTNDLMENRETKEKRV